jgi:hypothetical protein
VAPPFYRQEKPLPFILAWRVLRFLDPSGNDPASVRPGQFRIRFSVHILGADGSETAVQEATPTESYGKFGLRVGAAVTIC